MQTALTTLGNSSSRHRDPPERQVGGTTNNGKMKWEIERNRVRMIIFNATLCILYACCMHDIKHI